MANYTFRMKDDTLSHHGIEGQKWGVRNGPPYPLGSGDHSKAELRAMRKENKDNYKSVKRAYTTLKPSSALEADGIQKKLNELKETHPEIDEYIQAYKRYTEWPRSEEGQKAIEKIARRDFEKLHNRKPSNNDPAWESWLETNKERDIYAQTLREIPKYKDYEDSVRSLGNVLGSIYQDAAKDILGSYANKKVNGRTASDVLASALKYYFS